MKYLNYPPLVAYLVRGDKDLPAQTYASLCTESLNPLNLISTNKNKEKKISETEVVPATAIKTILEIMVSSQCFNNNNNFGQHLHYYSKLVSIRKLNI